MPTTTRRRGSFSSGSASKPKTEVPDTAAPSRRRRGGNTVESLNLTLPTEKSEPIKQIGEASFCLFGERKIGKTSLASQFDRAFFFMCEPGGKGLELYKREPANWRQFVGYVDLLVEDKCKSFGTAVIDVADKAYNHCLREVCLREGMSHPNHKPYGEGWKLVREEFEGQIERLHLAGYGIVFLSHAEDKEFETRSGMRYNKIVPTMSKQAASFVLGWVDIIGFYGYYGNRRYLTIRGSEELEAGCRLKRNFKTTSGKQVHSIRMFDPKNDEFDEEESYRKLLTAFNNKQTITGEPDDAATLSNKPAIRRKTRE